MPTSHLSENGVITSIIETIYQSTTERKTNIRAAWNEPLPIAASIFEYLECSIFSGDSK
jgi:hypothetical protein